MVVSKLREGVHREPSDVRIFFPEMKGLHERWDEGKIRDRHGPSEGISVRTAERIQLFQIEILHPCFFGQLALGRGIKRFVPLHQTAGESPAAGESALLNFHQKRAESILDNGEEDRINGYTRMNVFRPMPTLVCSAHGSGILYIEGQHTVK